MFRKILIIDDDPGYVATIRDRLLFEKYEVVTASDGDEGLDLVESERPDLVILDIMMPKLNGYAFLKMIHQRHPGGQISVIICTGHDDFTNAFKSEGIAGMLIKPFDPQELVNMVQVTFQMEDIKAHERQVPPATLVGAAKPQPQTTPTPSAPTPQAPAPASPPPQPEAPAPALPPDEAPPTAEAALETKAQEVPPIDDGSLKDAPARKPRVLVVDDEVDFASGLKDRLEFEGYEVMVANNGRDGLETAKREIPDMILLDVMMPELDGFMVCRLLKFDDKFKDVPIFMLTARNQEEDRNVGFSSGADDYIPKPVDFDHLLEKMRHFFKLRHLG